MSVYIILESHTIDTPIKSISKNNYEEGRMENQNKQIL